MDHAPDDELPMRRTIDLHRRSDRQLLRALAQGRPRLARLIDEHLGAYMGLFPETHWLEVKPPGWVVVPMGARDQMAIDLGQLLRLTALLRPLQDLDGYRELIRNFRNAPQLASTIHEVVMANWCLRRTFTRDLVLAPKVGAGRGVRPDFLWVTALGDLYCECKRSEVADSAADARMRRLGDVVRQGFDDHAPWPSVYRLDVWLNADAVNGVERRITLVVDAVARSKTRPGQVAVVGEVHGALVARDSSPTWTGEYLAVGMVTRRPGAAISGYDCDAAFAMPVARVRSLAARRLTDQARRQLPASGICAVFLGMGGINSALARVRRLLEQPSYARLPWIAVSSHDTIHAAWREGQPFDGRLTLGPGPDSDALEAAGILTGPDMYRIDDGRGSA